MKKSISWVLSLVMALTVFAIPTGAFAEDQVPASQPAFMGIYLDWTSYDLEEELTPISEEGLTYDLASGGEDFEIYLDEDGEPDVKFNDEDQPLVHWEVENPEVAQFVSYEEFDEDGNAITETSRDNVRSTYVRCLKEGTTKITADFQYESSDGGEDGEASVYFYLTVVDKSEYTICLNEYNYDEFYYSMTPCNNTEATAMDIDAGRTYAGYYELYLMNKDYQKPFIIESEPDDDFPEAVEENKEKESHLIDSDTVTWTSSDNSVAYIVNASPEDSTDCASVLFTGKGSVVLTATTSSGKTAHAYLNVTDDDWEITDLVGLDFCAQQRDQTRTTAEVSLYATNRHIHPEPGFSTEMVIQKYENGRYRDVTDEDIVVEDETSLYTNEYADVEFRNLQGGRRMAYRVRDVWTFDTDKGTVQRRSPWHIFQVTGTPDTPVVKKLSTKSKSITVKLAREYCLYYEMQLATNSKFTSGKKTIRSSDNADTNLMAYRLKKGKKYYVRVRAVTIPYGKIEVEDGKILSKWSKTKTITCK